MSLFGSKSPLDVVTKISVFPSISTVVLKKDKKLIIFNPRYLLGKHGSDSNQVSSKFMNLNTASQLLNLIDAYTNPRMFTGQKVELKEIPFDSQVGFDALVNVGRDIAKILPKEDVRGNLISVIYTKEELIPPINKLNIILVPFNPQFGQGVENLFKAKYGNFISFESFENVYSIVTIYPGKFAPIMSDQSFWSEHAMLKVMK